MRSTPIFCVSVNVTKDTVLKFHTHKNAYFDIEKKCERTLRNNRSSNETTGREQ